MRFKNPFSHSHFSVVKITLFLWVLFVTLYFLAGMRDVLVEKIYNYGVQQGHEATILDIISRGQNCQVVALQAGGQQFNFQNTACANPPTEAAEQ